MQALQQRGGESNVTFHVCAGLAGGTGSGCLIDVISLLREAHPEPNDRIVVYTLLPERLPKPGWDTGNYHANGYAALLELNALSVGTYKPYDVTGTKGRLDLKDPFNGCYVFSNENENGLIVDVQRDIPEIVANFLYQKLVTVQDVKWETLTQMENAENGNGTPETAPGTNNGERSKRFLTFGIKRLAIPEQEIREYLTYNFARQAALQLQYNNWSEALAFAEEPRPQSFKEMVARPEKLHTWLLTDEHLKLSVGILPDEIRNTKWSTINKSWEDNVLQVKTDVRSTYASNRHVWLTQLAIKCDSYFAREYRDLGVDQFYETKKGDKRDHLRAIRARIESELIEAWRNGTWSMADIRRILEALLELLQQRHTAMDEKIVLAQKNEEVMAKKIAANGREWATINMAKELFGARDRLFEAQASCYQDLYTYRTDVKAWSFAKVLLQAVIGELTSLASEVSSCAGMIAAATDLFNKGLANRCNDDGLADLKQQLVKFYDPEEVKTFTRTLVKNRDEQLKQTKAVRDKLLAPLGTTPTFAAFNQWNSKERFVEVLEQECERTALEAHDLLVSESRDRKRLLGDNVVDRIYQQYGGNIEDAQSYIGRLVKMAGNYVAFKAEEIAKVADGIPADAPTKVTRFTVICPPSEVRPAFSNAIRNAFVANTTARPEFIPSPEIPCEVKPNEITLISVTNLFPLRYLEQTAFLREKYAIRLAKGDSARAKLELHGEGDGSQLPSLYVSTMSEIKGQGLPYVLLGVAMKLIVDLENPTTGSKALFLVTKNEHGFDNPPVWIASTLVEVAERLSGVTANRVAQAVEAELTGAKYQHIDARNALIPSILALTEEIKVLRNNNLQDPVYHQFLEAGKKSVDRLKKSA